MIFYLCGSLEVLGAWAGGAPKPSTSPQGYFRREVQDFAVWFLWIVESIQPQHGLGGPEFRDLGLKVSHFKGALMLSVQGFCGRLGRQGLKGFGV